MDSRVVIAYQNGFIEILTLVKFKRLEMQWSLFKSKLHWAKNPSNASGWCLDYFTHHPKILIQEGWRKKRRKSSVVFPIYGFHFILWNALLINLWYFIWWGTCLVDLYPFCHLKMLFEFAHSYRAFMILDVTLKKTWRIQQLNNTGQSS